VLLPALTEDRTLAEVLDAVLAVPEPLELVLVDDGSTDRTWENMSGCAPAIAALLVLTTLSSLGVGLLLGMLPRKARLVSMVAVTMATYLFLHRQLRGCSRREHSRRTMRNGVSPGPD
jgi:uncharacterized membrane protein YphA (DoxX/SURF4 family)